MSVLAKILTMLGTEMEPPTPYGPFHIFFCLLAVVCGVILCRKLSPTERNVRRLLLITSVACLLLEVYKQIVFTFTVEDGKIVAEYIWHAFPWQFCSTPMYVGLLAALVKNRRLHHILCAYLGSFALFAGVAVMAYPATVFTETIGVNLQTMFWHGSMVTIGIYLLHSGYVPSAPGTLRRAFPVFAAAAGIACVLNEVVYHFDLADGDLFNMFYFSPHYDSLLPLYTDLHDVLPFGLSLAVYMLGFTAAAGIVLFLFHLLEKIYLRLRRRETTKA